jgi:hypothetical protein
MVCLAFFSSASSLLIFACIAAASRSVKAESAGSDASMPTAAKATKIKVSE